jgi:signal transduction histidine kinase
VRLTRPPLRLLLLASFLLVMALPLAGLWFLRIYESALVRQTESELIAQAAVVSGAWRAARAISAPGLSDAALDSARRAALDLARDPALPPAPEPRRAAPPDPAAAEAGMWLASVLRDSQTVTLAAMRILDAAGAIVATTGNDLGLSMAGVPEVDQARAGHPVSVLRFRERRAVEQPGGLSRTAALRVHVAMPIMDGGRVDAVVLLSRTPRTLAQAISGKLPEIAVVAALLLAVASLLALAASRLITRPLSHVVAQARRIADGEAVQLVPVTGPAVREAAELSDAIARMAATLEQRAQYVRDLAAHVSHEFKTPLASIRGAAELLGDHAASMSEAERENFVASIEAGTARLDRLVRGLLDLARADMTRPGGARASVRAVLERVAPRFEGLAMETSGDATVAMQDAALETVLASLLDNVRQHAAPARGVRIGVTTDGAAARITVADDGPGIPEAHAARIFDPFFTTARAQGGTGLGLAIARSLVTGAGGSLALAPAERGTMLVVTLPLAG